MYTFTPALLETQRTQRNMFLDTDYTDCTDYPRLCCGAYTRTNSRYVSVRYCLHEIQN